MTIRHEPLENRLARMESRLVQIMLHLGLDPYKKTYDDLYDKYQTPVGLDSHRDFEAQGRTESSS